MLHGLDSLAVGPAAQSLVEFVVGDAPAWMLRVRDRPGEVGEHGMMMGACQLLIAPGKAIVGAIAAGLVFVVAHRRWVRLLSG
jgi:hypothetical protein